MFYFLLWALISVFLLGFWVWSSYTLFQQKRSWRRYAEKKKMRYDSGGFYDSPSISGIVEGYTVALFTADHSKLDERSQRRLSSVELALHSAISVDTYMATGGMVSVMTTFGLPQEYKPEHTGWDDSYAIITREQAMAAAYFTPERLDAILSLTKIKNLWVIVAFIGGQGLVRIDLPDPVSDEKRLDILMKKMIEVAGVLELKKGEEATLLRKARDIKAGQGVIKVDNEVTLDQPVGLSLELEDEEFSEKPQSTSKKKKPAAADKNSE